MTPQLIAPLIVVLNYSLIPDPTIARWVDAIQYQVTNHFAPAWHATATLRAQATSEAIPADAWVVQVTEKPRNASVLASHRSLDKRRPVAVVYRTADTSASLSHEILEMIADPGIDQYVEDAGYFFHKEVCDPVEEDHYRIHGIEVSDFVLLAWFDVVGANEGPFDYLGRVRRPREIRPGGYLIVLDGKTGIWARRTVNTD